MPKSITLVAQGLSGGGAEMSMLRLAEDFVRRGYDVCIAVLWKTGRLVEMLPSGVRVIEVGGGRLSCIPRLARQFALQRPDAVIGFMTYANVVAILAQMLSPSMKKIVVSEHNTFTRRIKLSGGIPRLFHYAAYVVYRWTKAVVCVSHGVEDDLAAATHLPRRLLTTIYNPVITDDLLERSSLPPDHPWLRDKTCPVVLTVGRLEAQKNYPMLLRSFARVAQRLDCRLIVLGEGGLLGALTEEAERLGVADRVDFAGFRPDAMAFMHHADLFALSSDYRGPVQRPHRGNGSRLPGRLDRRAAWAT